MIMMMKMMMPETNSTGAFTCIFLMITFKRGGVLKRIQMFTFIQDDSDIAGHFIFLGILFLPRLFPLISALFHQPVSSALLSGTTSASYFDFARLVTSYSSSSHHYHSDITNVRRSAIGFHPFYIRQEHRATRYLFPHLFRVVLSFCLRIFEASNSRFVDHSLAVCPTNRLLLRFLARPVIFLLNHTR